MINARHPPQSLHNWKEIRTGRVCGRQQNRHRDCVRGFEPHSWRALSAGFTGKFGMAARSVLQDRTRTSGISVQSVGRTRNAAQVSRRFGSRGCTPDLSNMSSHSHRPCTLSRVIAATSSSPFTVVLPQLRVWSSRFSLSPPSSLRRGRRPEKKRLLRWRAQQREFVAKEEPDSQPTSWSAVGDCR